jgi:BASS family bile acid:Na+ symporter
MYVMDPATRILFYLFIITSMLGVGLKVRGDEVLSALKAKGLMVRALLANFVLIPAFGIFCARIIPMKPELSMTLIILACAPGGLSALQFLTKAKDEESLSYVGGIVIVISLLAIFISPAMMALALPKEMSLTTPYTQAFLFLLVFLLAPLLLGVFVHQKARTIAPKLAKIISLIGTLAFVVVIVMTLSMTKEAKATIGKWGILGMLLFILFAMFVGWLMGGPRKETRPLLATASSMRFVALGLAIAVRSFPEAGLEYPLVAFASLMIPANMILTVITVIRSKRAQKRALKARA